MKIKIEFDHKDNGRQIVTTIPADLLKWERVTGHKMTDLIKSRRVDGEIVTEFSIGYEDLMVMAWSTQYRTNQTADKFDAWVNGLDNIELAGVDDTIPPSQELSDIPSESSSPTDLSE